VTTRTIHQVRSNAWQGSFVASSAAVFSILTKDPSLSVVAAPMAALNIVFGGESHGVLAAAPRAVPAPTVHQAPAAREAAAGDEATALREAPAVDEGSALREAPAVDEGPALREAPAVDEGSAVPEAPAAAPSPDQTPSDPEQQPEEPNNRIELIIDSLSNHMLKEPIPVTIHSLGDAVFTASVPSLDMSGTGNSISEALLVLKGEIESAYEELTKRQHLSTDQKATLQVLHTYIAPQSKRSRWL
jgi:hypothetical protein